MTRTKGWHAVIATYGVDARKRDGRAAAQVRAMVAATSKKIAAERLGMSLYEFNNYASEVNPEDMVELSKFELGTVLVEPLDRGDTIDGTTGWRPRGGDSR